MFWHILKLSSTMYPPFEHSLLSSFSWSRRRKGSLPKSLLAFRVVAVRTSGLVNRVFFSRQTGFSSESIRLMIKPSVPTEPAIQSTRLLGLGLKLYPSNRPRMLECMRDYCRVFFKYARIEKAKEILLAGCNVSGNYKCCKWDLLSVTLGKDGSTPLLLLLPAELSEKYRSGWAMKSGFWMPPTSCRSLVSSD